LLTVLVTSPRVAPGLLTFEAWSVLRAASRVLAPEGHPQIEALEAAGITVEIALGPFVPAGIDAVWLEPPGSLGSRDMLDAPRGAAVLNGSFDLPGAHLLDLVVTMDRLRAECPWDAKQTHLTLAPHLLEEPYEALEALEAGDWDAFREELGDVLLQVVFHARIASGFGIDDIADAIVAKLVRRHPHVFGDVTVADAEEVKLNWDQIKKQERSEKQALAERHGYSGPGQAFVSALDGVPFGQPALSLAAQLQRRAERAGIPAELAQLGGSASSASPAPPSSMSGGVDPDASSRPSSGGADIGPELFALVAKARALGLDPELELRDAARRYRDRVRDWEKSRTGN
jgi:MazG family protein